MYKSPFSSFQREDDDILGREKTGETQRDH